MAAYLIVDTLLHDPDLYEQYKLKAKPIVEKYGGEYLARGGQLTLKETDLWTPTRMVVIRFPSAEQANKFYDSTEYRDVLPISKQQICRPEDFIE